jgi:cytidine deaminase
MKEITNKKLIEMASKAVRPMKLGYDNSAGGVAVALVSGSGHVYTGVCIDTISGMGYCGEANAIGSMITEGESKITKLVGVWKDADGKVYVLPPCGRCREFIHQVNKENLETDVILSEGRVEKLKDLLPYYDEYTKIKEGRISGEIKES